MLNLAIVFKILGIAFFGYLLGSINTSIIVGKIYGIDIRKHGSGNAGMTNTLRTLGKLPTVFVIIGDILKGILSCLVGLYFLGESGLLLGGTAAILGHIWPVYFNFKGGKGVLTALSVIIVMDYNLALILFGVFLIVLAITRYVSVGSIIGAMTFPIFGYIFNKSSIFISFSIVISILIIFMHRSNISRIMDGKERKFGDKKINS